jgi:hypothetical protein
MMGMRREDVDVWFDVYRGDLKPPHEVMFHRDFLRCLDESGGSAGAWSRCGDLVKLNAGGVPYVYRFTGYETAGGFVEGRWPD